MTNVDHETKEPRLDANAERTLEAVVLRILPSQDGVGAREAGCTEYVLRAVEERLPPATVKKIERGLAFADSLAQKMCGAPFAEVPESEQDRVLRQLQLTPHPTVQQFFHRLVTLTLEAFLCHPRHGGNRSGVGWSYLGIHTSRDSGGSREEELCTMS